MDCSVPGDCGPAGWCSLTFRFEQPELGLLRAAERAYGAVLAQSARAGDLPTVFALARAGRKVAQAGPAEPVTLTQPETMALRAALAYAAAGAEPVAPAGEEEPLQNLVAFLDHALQA